MGMHATGHLAFGIDFGEDKPDFLKDYDGELYDWVEEDPQCDAIESVAYFVDGHTILAVKDHVIDADYSSLVTEITDLDVDEEQVQAFKDALIAAGYPNPEPKWLLTFAFG
jgi:hypothetical protein